MMRFTAMTLSRAASAAVASSAAPTAAAAPAQTASTVVVCDDGTYNPVDQKGNKIFHPLREQLITAAASRSVKTVNPVWIPVPHNLCTVFKELIRLRPGVTPVPIRLPTDEVIEFVNGDDFILPHNVDVGSAITKATIHRHRRLARTIVGGWFSREFSDQLSAAADKMGDYTSTCWVSQTEIDFLGWHTKPGAVGTTIMSESMQRERSRNQNQPQQERRTFWGNPNSPMWFNVEDILDPVNFSEFFLTDRRMYNIVSGRPVAAVLTLRMQEFYRLQGLDPLSGPAMMFVGTQSDIQNGTNHEVAVLPDQIPFSTVNSMGTLSPLYVAAQTSDPDRIVAMARERREARIAEYQKNHASTHHRHHNFYGKNNNYNNRQKQQRAPAA